jgi:hypothetical protein
MSKIISILMFFLLSIYSFSQDISSNTILEREIKTSGNYFWGQAIDDSLEKAKLEARNDLMSNISDNINNSPSLNSNSDIFVNGIKYASFTRGSKLRVLSYILKSDVSNILTKKEPLKVIEMKYKESTVKDSVSEQKKVKDQFNTQTTNDLTDQNEPLIVNPLQQNQVKVQVLPSKFITLSGTGNSILDSIVIIKTVDGMHRLLEQAKKQGKLMYSNRKGAFFNTDDCLILIINPDDGSIKGVLKKDGSSRINLLTKELVTSFENQFKNMVYIWVQLY